MKFHAYAEGLFRSQVSISLIRALLNFKGKVFTVRSLARASNVSPAEAALVAKRLGDLGLLRLQAVGKSYQVTLNERNYVLNRIMKQIFNAEEKTLGELVSVLKKNFDDPKVIFACIFGSVSKSEERDDSDVDVLVISDDFEGASGLIARAHEDVFSIFGNRLSTITMSEKEFKRKVRNKNRLAMSILENHITFKGKDIGELTS
jgi:predicted nucleotidyltransferase